VYSVHTPVYLCACHTVSCPVQPGHDAVCFLQISQLVEDVQRLQASITKLQETSAGQIARLEEQLDHKRQHIARLEARLDAQRDYDDVKRELRSVRKQLVSRNYSRVLRQK
jgi:homeobox protein cut-like